MSPRPALDPKTRTRTNLTVSLAPEQRQRLEAYCRRHERTKGQVIRRLIDSALTSKKDIFR
jgi:predicted DNA-binding protein